MFVPHQLRKAKPATNPVAKPIRAVPPVLPTLQQVLRRQEGTVVVENKANITPRKRLQIAEEHDHPSAEDKPQHQQLHYQLSKKQAMANRYRHGNYDGYYSYRITDDMEADPRFDTTQSPTERI
jgi:hypothetical protein